MSDTSHQPGDINPDGYRDMRIPCLPEQAGLPTGTGRHVMPLKTNNFNRMKKYLISFLLLLGVLNVCGQYAFKQSDIKPQGYYYSKYRTQNKTGSVLALGGTTMVIVGAVGVMTNFDLGNGNSAENKRAEIFSYVFLTGVVADVISIPFFLSARKNKRKASFTINNQKIYLLQNGTFAFHQQMLPSLSLNVNL